jgi:chemotaxis family two-component system sensor kinase Cph1
MSAPDGRRPDFPDFEQCAREPIHIIGHIQSYGYLLALSEPDFSVTQVSANFPALLGVGPEDLLRTNLESVFGSEQAATLRERLQTGDLRAVNPQLTFVGSNRRKMDCVAHRRDGVLILELEPQAGSRSLHPSNIVTYLQGPIERMQRETDIQGLLEAAAREVQLVSGFDRVMVYRFDGDWNGQVVAEAGDVRPSLLGYHFPASDIPAQARRLFLINRLRSIADVDSEAVPIVPLRDQATPAPLDLSCSFLRSASPSHLEYLRNMGVRASLTLSIVVRGNLWGMVTAHHVLPHRLDFTTRAACDSLAQILAAQIAAQVDHAFLKEQLESRDRIEAYMTWMERSADTDREHADEMAPLLELLHADGLISRIGGVTYHYGNTIDETRLNGAIRRLRQASSRGISSSDHLSALDPDAAAYAVDASGALYLALSDAGKEYIVLLRRERVQTVLWAGDPRNPAILDPATGAPRARTSFASWPESVRGRSRPWTEIELENARLLREQLIQLSEARRRYEAEEQVRYLAHFDVLTGLPNRSSIERAIERELKRALGERGAVVVLFVDLDRFKPFNDRLGHSAGDRILQVVATRMQAILRGEDAVGRFGGDEFIALLPGIKTETEALEAAGRLLAEIEKPFDLAGETVQITASIGVSRYPNDAPNREVLLRHSDIAMYRAKEAGGNATMVFS